MDSIDIGRYMLSLFAVVALIAVLAFLAKKLGFANKMRQQKSIGGQMEVLDVLYLDARRKLMLVKCKETEYMLLLAGDSAQILNHQSGVSGALPH